MGLDLGILEVFSNLIGFDSRMGGEMRMRMRCSPFLRWNQGERGLVCTAHCRREGFQLLYFKTIPVFKGNSHVGKKV